MPFTFSHPAAVLPLKKLSGGNLLMAGLLAGSVAPDFEYFIRFKSSVSHTFIGILKFNLPVGLLITLLFFLFIRDSLLPNLPAFLRERLMPPASFDWVAAFRKHWFMLVVSILLGALTHILWDSFTHRTGYAVLPFPALRYNVEFLDYSIPVYRILQHGSTLLGGGIIAIYLYKMPRVKQAGKVHILYWFFYALLAAIAGIILYKMMRPDNLWYTALAVIMALLAPLIPLGIFVKIRNLLCKIS
jgi:hypothetical protein